MRMHTRLLAAVIGTLLLAGPVPAQAKNVAEFFPARTLAYVELNKPDQVSREILGLMKGSYLDDLPARLVKFREQLGDNQQRVRMLMGPESMFMTPEFMAELGRLQGAAVALTGFTKDKEPEVVGVIVAGDSNAPTFVQRVYLIADSDIRKVAEEEGVFSTAPGEETGARKCRSNPEYRRMPPVYKETGPTYALLPGTVIIGSTTESVKEAVRRVKGKSTEPSLATKSAIKDAAKLRDQPGLFAYADVPALASQLDEAFKEGKVRGRQEMQTWSVCKTLVNVKALQSVVASLSLHNGGVDLQTQLALDPKEASPLLDILPDKKANLDILHSVPRNALLTVTMSLPDGEKRWEKVLALLDACAKETGQADANLPSKVIAEATAKQKLNIAKDVMAKITGAALVMDARRGEPTGLLVLSTHDAADAKALGELVPKLLSLAGGEPTLPSSEKVQGQPIHSMPGDNLPWRSPLHYGSRDNMLVLGQDRDAVAEALVSGAKKEGLLSNAKVAAAVKNLDEPVVVGITPLENSFWRCPKPAGCSSAVVPKEEWAALPNRRPRISRGETHPGLDQGCRAVAACHLTLVRKPDRLVLEVRQPGLKSVSAPVINGVIDSLLQRFVNDIANRGGGLGGGIGPVD